MRSERLSIERFHAIDEYSPEGAGWAWESADPRRLHDFGFKSCPRNFGSATVCSDWSSIEGLCGGAQPPISAVVAIGRLMKFRWNVARLSPAVSARFNPFARGSAHWAISASGWSERQRQLRRFATISLSA